MRKREQQLSWFRVLPGGCCRTGFSRLQAALSCLLNRSTQEAAFRIDAGGMYGNETYHTMLKDDSLKSSHLLVDAAD